MDRTTAGSAIQALESLDALGAAALAVDAELKVLAANRPAADLLGLKRDEVAGRSFTELLKSPGSFYGEAGGGGGTFEAVIKKGGSGGVGVFDASLTVVPLPAVSLRLIIISDITGHVKPAVRPHGGREFAVLNAFAEVLSSARPVDTGGMMKSLAGTLRTAMAVDAVWVHRADEDGALVLSACAGADGDSLGCPGGLKRGECMAGEAAGLGRPLYTNDAASDARITSIDLAGTGFASVAAVPIVSGEKVWGVLSLGARSKTAFGAGDMRVLTLMCGQLGVAVENAKLIKELHEKMRQLKLVNELSGTVNTSLSIGTIFKIMLSELKKLIGYDRASLLLYDEERHGLLIFALDTGMKTSLPKGMWAPIEGISSRARAPAG